MTRGELDTKWTLYGGCSQTKLLINETWASWEPTARPLRAAIALQKDSTEEKFERMLLKWFTSEQQS